MATLTGAVDALGFVVGVGVVVGAADVAAPPPPQAVSTNKIENRARANKTLGMGLDDISNLLKLIIPGDGPKNAGTEWLAADGAHGPTAFL
jgi:hypothetical protein